MARIKEVTITYSRKNSTAQYESEDIFFALKFEPETNDDLDKAIDGYYMLALAKVDEYSHKGAKILVRKFTVTDQNGSAISPGAEKKQGEHKEQSKGETPKGPPTQPPEKPTAPDKTPMGVSPAKRGQSKLEQLTAEQIRRELKAWLEKNRLELIPSWLYGSDRIVIEAYDQMQCHGIHGWSAFIAQLEKQYPKEI
jgi:hypothetical protein